MQLIGGIINSRLAPALVARPTLMLVARVVQSSMTTIDLNTLAKNSPADGTQKGIYWCCLAVAAVCLGLF